MDIVDVDVDEKGVVNMKKGVVNMKKGVVGMEKGMVDMDTGMVAACTISPNAKAWIQKRCVCVLSDGRCTVA